MLQRAREHNFASKPKVRGATRIWSKCIAVIHKGKIPTPQQVEKFCSDVYLEIIQTLAPLKQKCPLSIHALIVKDLRTRSSKLPSGTRTITHSAAGLLSLADAEHKPSFEQAFNAYIVGVTKLKTALLNTRHELRQVP